jgi:ElaB/YqjD/DUF883 family membrane-anchored ribosome-binding protein
MSHALNKLQQTRDQLTDNLQAMLDDGEALLKEAATVSGDNAKAARAKLTKKLNTVRTALAEASKPLMDMTREVTAAGDHYVRDYPWRAVGVAAAAGVVVGLLAARRG